MDRPYFLSDKADRLNLAVISFVYILIILLSRFYTLYPIDDDWSYIRAAETFYKTGRISFTPWTSPSLIFQVVWGCLFSWVFGFSINTLILSTQVISFIGMVFLYLLLRETDCSSEKSLCITLMLILNPFSMPLLYTFFTDHHFIALVLVSTFFYYRGAAKKRSRDLLLGSVVASCAVLVRQPGLLISGAVGFYLIMRKDTLKNIACAVALPFITFLVFGYWFQNIHGPTSSSQQQMTWIIERLTNPVYILSQCLNRPVIILEFFGFCCIPLSLAMLPSSGKLLSGKHTSLLMLFCLSGVLCYLIVDHTGIYSSIYKWMNGFHFAYVSEYGFRGTQNLLLFFYKIAVFVSMFSITHIIFLCIKERKRIISSLSTPYCIFFLIGLSQLIFFIVIRYKFTRYYLLLLPFFILVLYKAFSHIKVAKKYFYPLLIGFALFSFIGTQDFLSWNEAKWKLGNNALENGISPRKLSGGFPWDCWHNMDYCIANPYDIVPQTYDIPWWFEELVQGIDPEYVISNSPALSGFYFLRYFDTDTYAISAVAEYYSLLHLRKKKIFLLKRIPRNLEKNPGSIYYSFLDNVIGAETAASRDADKRDVTTGNVSIGNLDGKFLKQPVNRSIAFRVSLPTQKCRMTFAVATSPDTWQSEGDGMMFKVMLSDHLLENLFDAVGMVGVDQRISFLKPRSYFFKSRTMYMHYLDPKHHPDQRKWHDVSIDLSRFSGKVVNITLEAGPGPLDDGRMDVALWSDPVIETY